MIFVDANVFLRHLTQPATTQDRRNAQHAAALFRQAEAGEMRITTSEATLAEVVFILSDARHYNVPRPVVQIGLQNLLRTRGLVLTTKDVCLHALHLWVEHLKLSFPDALGVAYVDLRGYELATFDVELGRVAGVPPFTYNGIQDSP